MTSNFEETKKAAKEAKNILSIMDMAEDVLIGINHNTPALMILDYKKWYDFRPLKNHLFRHYHIFAAAAPVDDINKKDHDIY